MILPVVALTLVSLLGLGALALDASRYFDLQTQLQKAADAFALAGAAELDGRPAVNGEGDAISRANAAIANLLVSTNANMSAWGLTRSTAVTTSTITYYSALSGNDSAGIAGGTPTTNPTAARFVEVVVTPVSINSFFSLQLLGQASNTMVTSAAAVAGFNEAVCKFTPFYICNPQEGQSESSIRRRPTQTICAESSRSNRARDRAPTAQAITDSWTSTGKMAPMSSSRRSPPSIPAPATSRAMSPPSRATSHRPPMR